MTLEIFQIFFGKLPWIFIAVAAILAWRKSKKIPLIIQAIAAALAFMVPLGAWVIHLVLNQLSIPWQARNFIANGFSFLTWIAFVAFAAAFCWDRITKS